jgi:hypothetical protein
MLAAPIPINRKKIFASIILRLLSLSDLNGIQKRARLLLSWLKGFHKICSVWYKKSVNSGPSKYKISSNTSKMLNRLDLNTARERRS